MADPMVILELTRILVVLWAAPFAVAWAIWLAESAELDRMSAELDRQILAAERED